MDRLMDGWIGGEGSPAHLLLSAPQTDCWADRDERERDRDRQRLRDASLLKKYKKKKLKVFYFHINCSVSAFEIHSLAIYALIALGNECVWQHFIDIVVE